ncbi:MAG: Lrp/AsnC family transcriptional regulator [Euryarchaeota archaeon]|nr:Lrp/AsnC family transcriptional regulator [Euryarchaeota archaeon]
MDDTDLKILKMLRDNSRESLGVIAEKTGTSKATISRRITKLEDEGYISSYTLNTNLAKLGLMRAQVGIEVSGNLVDHVVDELRSFKEIQTIYKVFGDHSLICELYTKSVDSLYDIIQSKILKISGIQNVEVDILIESIVMNPDAELDMLVNSMQERP